MTNTIVNYYTKLIMTVCGPGSSKEVILTHEIVFFLSPFKLKKGFLHFKVVGFPFKGRLLTLPNVYKRVKERKNLAY